MNRVTTYVSQPARRFSRYSREVVAIRFAHKRSGRCKQCSASQTASANWSDSELQ